MNEILMYGEVGWELLAKDIVTQLAAIGDEDVTVRLNSPGGDAYEGLAIMNALRAHTGVVTVIIEGLAASAASVIAVGGADRVVCRPSAEIMVHDAWTFTDGNAESLAKMVTELDRLSNNLASIYAERTGGEVDQWRDLMKIETWFSADEALAAGLVDAVEDARQPAAAAVRAPVSARMLAKFKHTSRSDAPAPSVGAHISTPRLGQEGGGMGFLDKLAQELGKTSEEIKAALLAPVRAEVVPISGEVEVTYPSDVKIVPTEKITVAPVIGGDAPDDAGDPVVEPAGDATTTSLAEQAGLTFTMGDVADGFIAEVDDSGVVTITAPSGAEVGATAVFTVLVNDTPVALSVTVRSLSEDTGEDETPAPDEGVADPSAPVADQVVLDSATYSELRAAAQYGWKAMEAAQGAKLEAEVDAWIREGRISAGMRTKAVNAIKQNAGVARDLYGSNPVGTIPRAEVGYGVDDQSPNPQAQAMREKKNPFSKPKL